MITTTEGACYNPFAGGKPMTRKRVNTDLFLAFDLMRDGYPLDLSECSNLRVSVQKQGGLTPSKWRENITTNGSRIGLQINASENQQVGVFNITIEYDVDSEDSETGFIHVAQDIQSAFEIVPTSQEEVIVTTFILNGKELKAKEPKDGRLKEVKHEEGDTTATLQPHELHVWGEVRTLSLSLAESSERAFANEYAFAFKCPSDAATTLTLPTSVKWADGVVIVPEAGKQYEGSIIDGKIVLIKF